MEIFRMNFFQNYIWAHQLVLSDFQRIQNLFEQARIILIFSSDDYGKFCVQFIDRWIRFDSLRYWLQHYFQYAQRILFL